MPTLAHAVDVESATQIIVITDQSEDAENVTVERLTTYPGTDRAEYERLATFEIGDSLNVQTARVAAYRFAEFARIRIAPPWLEITDNFDGVR